MLKLKRLYKIIILFLLLNKISFSFLDIFQKQKDVPQVVSVQNGRPAWTMGTGIQSKEFLYYGVGSAKKHFDGKTEQKRLALARAVEEIAAQKELIVNAEINMYQKNEQTTTYQKNEFVIDNSKVSFKILETWTDPDSGEIFYLVGGN